MNSMLKILYMSSSSTQLAVALFLIILQSYTTYGATNEQQCSGYCGDLKVSHPFWLKEYPQECYYRRWGISYEYNLSCEDNQLFLYLQSGKYKVLSINYVDYTIQLRDSNITPFNLSSMPRHSLSDHNFTNFDPYTTIQQRPDYDSSSGSIQDNLLTELMIYVKCTHEVKSTQYVDTAPCMKKNVSNNGSYLYANVGSYTVGDLEEGCRIELMYMTSSPNALNNLSCTDIHSMLLYGFQLSWLNSLCFGSQTTSYFYASTDTKYDFVCGRNRTLWEEIGLYIQLAVSAVTLIFALHTCAKVVLGTPIVFVFLIYKWRRRHLSMYENIENFLQSDNNIMPIRYSYKEIKKMTQGFKIKLGKGGYGSVFKGQLRSGRLVAIKMLDNAKADGQEFINEVATLGRIHHVNVVQLIGYCVEGSKRALVYEFMQNGSLEKYTFSQQDSDRNCLNCGELYAISLGVARGIEYLHKGCNIQILHFDIKPHNILLDEHFNPKVSDFGLAKLYPTKNSIVSLTAARGTIGYMAPELFYRNVGGVSYKADVYSFGMLLMEMAGRRKNLNAVVEQSSSQLYFPFWVHDQLCEGREIDIVTNATEEEMKMARKMMKVGLWCIQTKPIDRPSMSKVVEMLEGEEEDLEMPPKPYLYPQDFPAKDVRDHSSSTRPSSDSAGSNFKDSVSLLA